MILQLDIEKNHIFFCSPMSSGRITYYDIDKSVELFFNTTRLAQILI